MRFVLELNSDDDGRVSGDVCAEGARPVAFHGWVQLLRALEDGARLATDGEAKRPVVGQEEQETEWDA